ncbi:phage tail protein, partial [Escherichia coli]
GMYVIESLSQTKTEFFASGEARKIEFSLGLNRVDESLSEMFGSLNDQLSSLQDSAAAAVGKFRNTVGGLLQ